MNIIIGNAISFIAGIFLIISCCVNDEKSAYKYQFLEAFTLTISSVFFISWTGVTTMGIAAIRNAMVYRQKLTIRWTVFFTIITIVFGLAVNTLGFIGLLPIIATVQITLCNYYLKSIKAIKLSFIVNLLFYIAYFIVIYDFTSAVIQIVTAVIGAVSLIRLIMQDSQTGQSD